MSTETLNSGQENTSTQTDGNENTSTQTDGHVQMSQADFDALIGKKMGKASDKARNDLLTSLGVNSEDDLKMIIEAKKQIDEANRTELEKLQELLSTANAEKDKLAKDLEATNKQATLNAIAAKHGVKELDYFALELRKVQSSEDYNEEQFIATLKQSKPFVFGQSVNTDNSSNSGGQPKTLLDKVQGLSFEELRKLQNSI